MLKTKLGEVLYGLTERERRILETAREKMVRR